MSIAWWRARLFQAAREPFVHFLLIGVAIFAISALRGPGGDPAGRRIVVTEAQVSRLVGDWMQTWRRPPTPAETDGIIRDYVKEEIYYREALRLGLDKDDQVVRRRLRSKMEFLAVSQLDSQTPDDRVLQAFLDRRPEVYAADPRFTFDQVYIAARPGDRVARDRAVATLARLRGGSDPKGMGDPLDAPASLTAAASGDIARRFGPEFAGALGALPVGAWSGPVTSGYGLHLVRLRAVVAASPPSLDQVRRAVENDWRAATLAQRQQAGYQALLDAYDVRIERPR